MIMDAKTYRRNPAVSRSDLMFLEKTPQHYRYHMDNPEEKSTPAMVFGSAVHKLVLEPEDFHLSYAVLPAGIDRRTREGKAAYENFIQDAAGKTIISEEDYRKAVQMMEQVYKNPVAEQLLTGTHEESFFWTDPDTGIDCKIRPDCLTTYQGKPYIVDYKTTDSCEDGHFERSCRKYGYKLQAGMYCEGMMQQNFEDYGFAFVAQEKTEPYAVRVYVCSPEFIREGYDEFRRLIGTLKWCQDNGRWYGYEGPDGAVSTLAGEEESDD